jgi:hypothetical protein
MEPNPLIQQPPLFRPKNWLVESILVLIFCCLPFGIVGLVYSTQVNAKYDAGDFNGAKDASDNAGKWTKIGFFTGLIVVVLYILVIVVFGVGVAFLESR